MIDLRFKTLGGPEVAKKLALADSGIRQVLREELAEVGDEIVSIAQSNAPKRTGVLASRIIWFFGKRGKRGRGLQRRTRITDVNYKDGRINFSVMPTGSVAHLMERGVNASFYQRPGRGGANQRTVIGPFMGARAEGPEYRYPRTLRIAPRPFFIPAVDAVGGADGVNARLQGALNRLASEVSR